MHTPTEQAARDFCRSPIWDEAVWLAAAYQWHPTGEMPPVMGLVFADWRRGVDLFRGWVEAVGHADEHDDLRVAILEGGLPGQSAGYAVRLSPSLNEYLDPDEAEHRYVGQVVRMHPQRFGPEDPDLLGRFKRDYARHGEFMVAPAMQRGEGQLYLDVQRGIIKRELVVRQVHEIGPQEPDALALRSCDDEGEKRQAAECMIRMLAALADTPR